PLRKPPAYCRGRGPLLRSARRRNPPVSRQISSSAPGLGRTARGAPPNVSERCDMSQSNVPEGAGAQAANLQVTGTAAIIAPVSAFQGGIPQNALIVLPLSKPSDEILE